jgi:hypothetical protein
MAKEANKQDQREPWDAEGQADKTIVYASMSKLANLALT